MYVEADVLYAYLKDSDWLKNASLNVIKRYTSLLTSVITVTEIELVSKRDIGEDFSLSVLQKVMNIKNVKLVPLDTRILKKAQEYRKKFRMNIFDALHAATAFTIKREIISTDNIYDLIGEVRRIDPREIR